MYLPPEIRKIILEEVARCRAKKEQTAATAAKPVPKKKP
jgi:hypothetical protein